MNKTSVRELDNHPTELVADLRPAATSSRLSDATKAQIFDSMGAIWARMPQFTDSTEILDEDRDR